MNVPYFYQKDLFSCGAIATKMILAFYGINENEVTLKNVLHTSVKGGTSLLSIQNYFENLGFKCDKQEFKDQKLAFRILKKAASKNPLILIVNRLVYNQKTPRIEENVDWESDTFSNHIVVITNVDEKVVFFNDPIKEIGQTSLPIETFLKAWFSEQDGGLMLGIDQ